MADISVTINPSTSYSASVAEVVSGSSISFDSSDAAFSHGNVQDAISEIEHRNFTQAATPTGSTVNEGDLWYDSDDDIMYVRSDTGWSELVQENISGTIDGGTY